MWLIERMADATTVRALPEGGSVVEAEFVLPQASVIVSVAVLFPEVE